MAKAQPYYRGVYGGINSGVKTTTTDIFLESAHFNPKWIRRTSMGHNLRTDATKVFKKGQRPQYFLVRTQAGGPADEGTGRREIASEVVDLSGARQPGGGAGELCHVNRLIGIRSPRNVHSILRRWR